MFCKHDWKLISETTTKSKYEHAIGVLRAEGATSLTLPWQLSCADRKFIQVISCTKCGKLSRFVESI